MSESQSDNVYELADEQPAPETGLVVQETITKKHVEIGDELLSRIRNLIASDKGEITHYAVSRASGSWDTNDEIIHLKFGDDCTLVLAMKTKNKKLDS